MFFEVDASKSKEVVPLGEVVVPDHWRRASLVVVENFNISVCLAEIVAPQCLSSDHRHVHLSYTCRGRTAMGVNHSMTLTLARAVLLPVANLAVDGAVERLGTCENVVTDGVSQAGL